MAHSFLSQLQWRYATKNFDPAKAVLQDDLDKILAAIQLTPSGFGLQPFHIFVVSDQKIRRQLVDACYMQSQVHNAPYILVFCARSDIQPRINQYLDLNNGKKDEANKANLQEYKEMMLTWIKTLNNEERICWASKQAYIALGFAVAACAELAVDSCPMEGFEPEKVNEILKLPHHLQSTVLLAIGHRQTDPAQQKTRFPQTELVTRL